MVQFLTAPNTKKNEINQVNLILRVYPKYSQHRRLIGLVITVYLGFQQVFYTYQVVVN